MIVYHGSDVIVDSPKILSPNRPLDFGNGFYVTTSLKQAKTWALIVSKKKGILRKCVSSYEFDFESSKKVLKIMTFDNADEKWLDFICDNRNGKNCEEYDIVIGPVADDSVYEVVLYYSKGKMSKEIALKELAAEKLVDQILFHSEKSLKFLKYIETEVNVYE